MSAPSPFAPASFPDLPPIGGVRLAVAEAGIRYRERTDLLLADLTERTSVAGVFTRSQTAAAPVLWCRKVLAGGHARALIVNAGNANAFTGRAGEQASADSAAAVAALRAVQPRRSMSPLPASSARRCRRRSWSPLCHKRLMLLARRLGSTPRAPSPPPIPFPRRAPRRRWWTTRRCASPASSRARE